MLGALLHGDHRERFLRLGAHPFCRLCHGLDYGRLLVLFRLLVLVLLFKPTGLLGERMEEKI